MKVYKERHLSYSFNIKSEYVFKAGPQKGQIYNGPLITFRGATFAGEKMTAEVEKKWEVITSLIEKVDQSKLLKEKQLEQLYQQ